MTFRLTLLPAQSSSFLAQHAVPYVGALNSGDPYKQIIGSLLLPAEWLSTAAFEEDFDFGHTRYAPMETREFVLEGNKPLNHKDLELADVIEESKGLNPFARIATIMEAAHAIGLQERHSEKEVDHRNVTGSAMSDYNVEQVRPDSHSRSGQTITLSGLTFPVHQWDPPFVDGVAGRAGTIPIHWRDLAPTQFVWGGPGPGTLTSATGSFVTASDANVDGTLVGVDDPFGILEGVKNYSKWGATRPDNGLQVSFAASPRYLRCSSEQSLVNWTKRASGGFQRRYFYTLEHTGRFQSSSQAIASEWTQTYEVWRCNVSGKGVAAALGPWYLESLTTSTVTSIGGRRTPDLRGPDDVTALRTCVELRNLMYRNWMLLGTVPDCDRFDLCQRALDAGFTVLESNMVENLSQWRTLRKQLPSTSDLSSLRAGSLGRRASAIASLYLWYRYVYKTNVADGKDILSSMFDMGQLFAKQSTWLNRQVVYETEVSESSVQELKVTSVFTEKLSVRPDKDPLTRFLLSSKALGLHPGLQQAWDLIPYSFVVDWFTSIGDVLEDVDDSIYMDRYGLEYRLSGTKHSATVDLAELGDLFSFPLQGTMRCILYSRRLSMRFPRMQCNFGAALPRQWYLAGAALLVAKRKR